MKERRPLLVITVFLVLAIGNFTRLKGNENIRPLVFLSIFAIGMLSGILIREVGTIIRSKK